MWCGVVWCGVVWSIGHRQAIGVMIAASEINSGRAFGIPNNPLLPPGYTISVYLNDTKNSPTIGCQAANVLINTNQVIGIVGEYFSAVSQAISTFAGVFQVPIVSPGIYGHEHLMHTYTDDTYCTHHESYMTHRSTLNAQL